MYPISSTYERSELGSSVGFNKAILTHVSRIRVKLKTLNTTLVTREVTSILKSDSGAKMKRVLSLAFDLDFLICYVSLLLGGA